MAKFTLWTPWTATSQTPWIRIYTPFLATISKYHQINRYHLHVTLSTQPSRFQTHYTTNITHTTYTNYIQNINYTQTTTHYTQSTGHVKYHSGFMLLYADPMQSHAGSCRHMYSLPLSSLILLDITHLIQGLSYFCLFFLTLHPLFVDRLCIHMT